jgi:hypothetical protein
MPLQDDWHSTQLDRQRRLMFVLPNMIAARKIRVLFFHERASIWRRLKASEATNMG